VIARIAPGAAIVDLTHDVARWDVAAGAMTLWRAAPWLAPGVVLAVVDPGVATPRRAIALETGASPPAGPLFLVGPDNGILGPAARAAGIARAVVLDNPAWHFPNPSPNVSGATFAGRDVFAPAAAHLSRGVDLGELGSPIDPASIVGGESPGPVAAPGGGVGCVITWVDHFGNAQLNITPADLAGLGPDLVLVLPRIVRPISARASFAEIPSGALGLVTDSYGRCAICVDRGAAAAELGLSAGDSVVLR
jgi:S-adenosylmethionine hydrolase